MSTFQIFGLFSRISLFIPGCFPAQELQESCSAPQQAPEQQRPKPQRRGRGQSCEEKRLSCPLLSLPAGSCKQLHTFSHDEKFPQRQQQRPRSREDLTGAGRTFSAARGSSTSLLSVLHTVRTSVTLLPPITPTTHTRTYTQTAVLVNLIT